MKQTMAGMGLPAKLWRVLLVVAALALQPAARADGVGTRYTGFDYMYTRAESYSSILGGRVELLQPAGFDYYALDWVPWAVLVEGVISTETSNTVYNMLKANPQIGVVYLNSPGGDLFAGMILGAMLHDHGLTAVVNIRSECESACALALLGGNRRLVFGDNDKFGFHRQFYIVKGQVLYASWAKDVAQIRKYLDAVQVQSITAEEIVGTTQLITYSDARMKERGLVSATRQEVWDDEIREVHGDQTAFELYLTLCYMAGLDYGCRINPESVFPVRLPMLIASQVMNPATQDESDNKRLWLGTAKMMDTEVFVPTNGFDGRTADDINIECRKNPDPFIEGVTRRETMIATHVKDASKYEKTRDELIFWCNQFAAMRKGSQPQQSANPSH